MEQAMEKLRTEMEASKNNPYVQLIGKYLIQHIQTAQESAELIIAEGKSLKGSLAAMKSEAQKKAVDGMAVLTDVEGYSAVLKYYGIQGQPVNLPEASTAGIHEAPSSGTAVIGASSRFDVSLDDLL